MKAQKIKWIFKISVINLVVIFGNNYMTAQEVISDTCTERQKQSQSKQLERKEYENIRISRPWGVSFTLFGGTLFGTSMDYFVVPQLSLEAGVGFSQYLAVKYHFFGGQKNLLWSPFIGAAYCWPSFLGDNFDGSKLYGVISIPIGLHYIARSGFSFSVSISIVYLLSFSSDNWFEPPGRFFYPMPGFRIGYHF